MELSRIQADAFVEQLDVGLDDVCLACLSFVTSAIHDCDPAEVRRWVSRMAPSLWDDGLDEQILARVREASARETPGAAEALADVEQNGARSVVTRAVVLRLANELADRERRGRAAHLN